MPDSMMTQLFCTKSVLYCCSAAVRNKRGDSCPLIMGRDDICNLDYNQITWPGTHNSGSGFNGPLVFRNGFPTPGCVYRNQDLNYTAQLDFGIRWFDIDLCWVTDEEATTAVSAGLWTCHSNGYAGKVDEILRQVNDWLNMSPNYFEIVSLFFNGDYDRSRSEPIANALNELLESYWTVQPLKTKRSRPFLTMNSAFNTTGEWPTLILAANRNERVFVFVHESLQLGDQPWAHDPVPSTSPSQVIKDSCDGLIDFSRGACNVCTDLWAIDAIGSRGNCIYRTAEICNTITYNVTRDCLDLRMEYGKTLNVIEVDFPDRAPEGLSVVDIANKFNTRNYEFFFINTPTELPNATECTPDFTPTPSPSPTPRPATYCDALKQIAEMPLYYFQCSPNEACDTLLCPTDLFADGFLYSIDISVVRECNMDAAFAMEIFTPLGGSAGRVEANTTGVYLLLAFPLVITIDQMEDAIGVGVSTIFLIPLHKRCYSIIIVQVVINTGDNRGVDNTVLTYTVIPLPTAPECPSKC